MPEQNPDSVRPPLDEHDWAFYGEAFVLAEAVRRFLARRQTQFVIDEGCLDDDVVRDLTESADRIWLIRTQRISAARAKSAPVPAPDEWIAPTITATDYAIPKRVPPLPLGWWAISGESFLDALRRAHAGEDPDALYAEHYANTDVEHVDGPEEGER